MIALCREHHDAADRGLFSRDELRSFKQKTLPVDDVKAHFPWAKPNILVRLGGVYCGGSGIIFAVHNEPIIHFTKDESGLLFLSFDLRAADGCSIVGMEENMFLADPDVLHDLEIDTGPTKVKAWFARRDVGLDLSFKRVTLDELNGVMAEDRRRAESIGKELQDRLPPDLQALIGKHRDQPPPSWEAELPDEIREIHCSNDRIGTMVRKWAMANCQDDEQRIPFLDFKNMVVHHSGRRIVIRNGIREGEGGIVYSASLNNVRGAFNL
jgi:hypothetical protein